MKKVFFLTIIIFCVTDLSIAQKSSINSRINLLLLNGEYKKVIDTCKLIFTYDSLNSDIYYKIGVAYQNTLDEDQSLKCFYKAVSLNPDNNVFSFSLAKGFYNSEKFKLAEPLLFKLCSLDSMNWVYAFYLSSIYMQSNRFDDAINIYRRFLKQDSTNCVYLDKIAFAYLKKGDFQIAIDLYSNSLSIDNKNLTAIKNLSFLYASTMNSDTAIQILTKGIEIDSTDMDLYIRRAQLYYLKSYTKRALDDYLIVLASGDSSKLYLKRAGIGYSYNLQPNKALVYLLKAYNSDSADYETCSYLGQCYYHIKNMKRSIYYYNRAIKILTPVEKQLGLTYVLHGDSYYYNEDYIDAITSYLNAQDRYPDPKNYMKIANIYDDKLGNKENSIIYYQKFLENLRDARFTYTTEYIESIKKRLDYLKEEISKQK